MGYMNALGMAGQVDLETAIRWHLTSNCYPPQPESLVIPCVQAVKSCAEDSEDDLIDLLDISHRIYGQYIPAFNLVDELQLHAFVDSERNRQNELDISCADSESD